MKLRRCLLTILLALSTATCSLHAQLCQGSLGDPLVNITFGAGANPGSALAAATTSYQFIGNDCPNDGYYTVRTNTAICFSSTWHSLNADHTGNPNGYFMLINASYQPSAFYLDTVRGLCGGTTYEFAAWVINMLKTTACGSNGIQPNLTFTIERTDGTVIQTYSSGNIPSLESPAWQQYGFYFTTPTGVSDIVLRIFNNSPGGCGNDLALDDITFRPCGPQISVTIDGLTTASVKVCEGTPQSFTFNSIISAGFNTPSLQWQQSVNGGAWTDIPGETSPSFSRNFPANTNPGVYSYRLSAAESGNMSSIMCRVASEQLTIDIAAKPIPQATSNSPLCEGNTLVLTAKDGNDYQWTGVNGFAASGDKISIDNATASLSGKYYVWVTNSAGCSRLDSTEVTVNINPLAATTFAQATICEGDNIQLESNGGGTYQWIPATGLSSASISNPVASPADTTDYRVVVTNQFGCTDTTPVTIYVASRPRVNAGPDQYIMKGTGIQVSATATGQNITYTWSPPLYIDDVNSLTPTLKPPFDTTYVLTAVSNEGCGTAADAMHVYVYPDIYVPNAFSPDNDGLNDTWFIPSLRAWKEYTVSVYNRQGQLIFHAKNSIRPWDGKFKGVVQPVGAYVYVIDLKGGKVLKGSLVITR